MITLSQGPVKHCQRCHSDVIGTLEIVRNSDGSPVTYGAPFSDPGDGVPFRKYFYRCHCGVDPIEYEYRLALDYRHEQNQQNADDELGYCVIRMSRMDRIHRLRNSIYRDMFSEKSILKWQYMKYAHMLPPKKL